MLVNADGSFAFHNLKDDSYRLAAFTYSFGKVIKNLRKRDTGSADSEQGRAH